MTAGRKRKQSALINREWSWMRFNRRVQMEADNPDNPLLERAKFLAIVTSNLDEFMQVRYLRIYAKAHGKGGGGQVQGGLSARRLYRTINKEILHQQNLQYLLYEGIRSELFMQGVQLYPIFPLTPAMEKREADLFREEIAPSLHILSGKERPRQKQPHLMVKLIHPKRKTVRFAIVALPTGLPRLYNLAKRGKQQMLIRLEDIVRHQLARVFSKEKVVEAHAFRLLCNQDFPLEVSSKPQDIPRAARAMLDRRRAGRFLRLEAEERMPEEMLHLLMLRFGLREEWRYRATGPLDLNKLMMNLYGLMERGDLKYIPVEQQPVPELMDGEIFKRIATRDYLLYHPYHSFAPVVHFIDQAARDPAVRAIKQTLYRINSNSAIAQSLALAVENGKEVTVLLEAYARFDEENNLYWGERLQRAGCRVLYGVPGLKTHSKITLVEREERGTLRRYLHLSTGNYHEGTARLYTDLGLLTCDEALGRDAQSFFAGLEGEPGQPMEKLVKAPESMQSTLLHLVEREGEHAVVGRPCGICAKMNSLSDERIIGALYRASQAGVPIRLIVRGICCLRPGVKGLSENIQVISIVGRHLEHARAFRFENGGAAQVFLSSADWMPRNLERRVELMFPVEDPVCKRAVENLLELQWKDTVKARVALKDGTYVRQEGRDRVNAQEELLYHLESILSAPTMGQEALVERKTKLRKGRKPWLQ